MLTEYFNRNKIPSFGECIYCRKKAHETKLTNEHTIPFSLGGNVEIIDGSCLECAAITSKIELHVGRKVLWDLRVHTGTQTRRPKDRPKALPINVSIAGAPLQTMQLPIADHPFFTPMPVWGLPALLIGSPPSEKFQEERAHVYYYIPPNIRETLQIKDNEIAEIPFPDFGIDSHQFARAIAKMAYCQAVITFGLYGFRRLVLPDLILGKYPLVPYFVGSETVDPPPPLSGKVMHMINMDIVTIGRIRLIVASVRIFANSGTANNGTPVYRVVVGAPKLSKCNQE